MPRKNFSARSFCVDENISTTIFRDKVSEKNNDLQKLQYNILNTFMISNILTVPFTIDQ